NRHLVRSQRRPTYSSSFPYTTLFRSIFRDLEEAEELLPETTNRIRATKKTVWALKARYYLYQQEWGKAIEYATKIIGDQENYRLDRKSTRLNSSHVKISYAVFCLKKK